jgi:hypothetical protein
MEKVKNRCPRPSQVPCGIALGLGMELGQLGALPAGLFDDPRVGRARDFLFPATRI